MPWELFQLPLLLRILEQTLGDQGHEHDGREHHGDDLGNECERLDLGRGALTMVLTLASPILVIGMAVGLSIALLQAVTQLQDQTLSFVPKIVAMLVTLIIVFPWVMTRMIEYSTTLIREIPSGL